jgi:hypothetical protein
MMRRLITATGIAVGVAIPIGTASAADPIGGCRAQGTELLTIQEAASRIDLDGPYTPAEVAAIVEELADKNDDGMVCYREFKPNRGQNMKTGDPNDAIYSQFLDNTAGPKK